MHLLPAALASVYQPPARQLQQDPIGSSMSCTAQARAPLRTAHGSIAVRTNPAQPPLQRNCTCTGTGSALR
ncbi:hypothetical protein BCR44DRAFT_1437665 [Catenaria anguillulae PL171]|uniref:Uncharacterized protein n=1 Tax=Catenaria anguillulae PL171 TaxID=765915 RepID=A0A1Y2HIL5_9FUNG|nr:hypothetical protein BCR44DRAFT_1437665 [Catenaria anguillulae PL171]